MTLHCLSCPVVCVGQNRSYQITSSHNMRHFASRRCMNLEGRKEKGRVLVSWGRLKMRGSSMTLGSQQDKPRRRTDVKMQVGLKTQKMCEQFICKLHLIVLLILTPKNNRAPLFFWLWIWAPHGPAMLDCSVLTKSRKRVESTHKGVN